MAEDSAGDSSSQLREEVQELSLHEEDYPFEGIVDAECEDEEIDAALVAPPESDWYHGRLGRVSAEERLRRAGKLSGYLIRESERKPGSYVLSYFGVRGPDHFRIIAMCGDFYIGGRQFDSLSDLIGYYTNWSCILKDEKLMYPVPPPEPVQSRRLVRAILPYTRVPDTDELSFEKGDVFMVHNTMDGGWLWVTSQRTNESGLVIRDLVEELDFYADPHEGKEWFHGTITKEKAAELLSDAPDSAFLIRPSDSSPGDYSLFFRSNNLIQRFRITRQNHEQFEMGGHYYATLDDIIKHYKTEQIVEGYTLGEPVPNKRSRLNSLNDEDIYQSVRARSTGSCIITQPSDTIVKKGYLSKKGHRSKKWKNLFFILNGTEQHVYYFENEKRTKPKGLIDLNYASIYPVHESLFGRPNCFQTVVRALNDITTTYLCADTAELAKEWILAMRQFSTQPSNKQSPLNAKRVKQLRSLSVNVLDARNLPVKHLPHPYCVLSLHDVHAARTQMREGPNPLWSEEFVFEDLPREVESFTLLLCSRARRSKDAVVASVFVPLSKLPNGQYVDEWYPVIPESPYKGDMGSIRIRAHYRSQLVLPLEEYAGLKQLIVSKEFHTIYALDKVCARDRSLLASALLRVFRQEKNEAVLLQTLTTKEIANEDESATLFRATTLASTLMDQYMKMTAVPFLHQAVKEVITKIADSKQSCEHPPSSLTCCVRPVKDPDTTLNPTKLEKGADVNSNLETLLSFLTEAVEAIFKATESCPSTLRYIFGCLQREVLKKWPDDTTMRTRVVSGFIFLRLICPAILNPRQFNLLAESPTPTAARTLTMVAKSLQNLANLVEFGAKEPYMEAVNPFIVKNKERMIMFLDELANVPSYPEVAEKVKSDPSQDLATLHQICLSHLTELQTLSTTQSHLKKLLAVTEHLSNRQQQYMGTVKR
ncbi:ras GTPase-activating protein 1-like isoform X3 [Branchiostoma floridae x Branchiostoma belcheri]